MDDNKELSIKAKTILSGIKELKAICLESIDADANDSKSNIANVKHVFVNEAQALLKMLRFLKPEERSVVGNEINSVVGSFNACIEKHESKVLSEPLFNKTLGTMVINPTIGVSSHISVVQDDALNGCWLNVYNEDVLRSYSSIKLFLSSGEFNEFVAFLNGIYAKRNDASKKLSSDDT